MTSILIPTPTAALNAPTVRRLADGLTIIAEQIPVDAVNLNIWLNVGSAVESDAINGMAHFLEHMIFKGTDRLTSGEFERRVEERGAVTNAATSQDYTHYYITTAPQDFAALAPLQIEVLLNAQIPDDGFERERHVVLEEIRRSADNPQRRTFQRSSELTFAHLPYRRPVLGPAEVIEQLTVQQMRDFHRYWYQPQRLTVAVVGNLPVDELIQTVAASFDQAARSEPSLSSYFPQAAACSPESPFDTIVRQEYTDAAMQQARLVMVWRVPGLTDLDRTYALDVLASILAHGRTSRLVRDLREQRGLVSGISASNMTYQHQGAFYISARLPEENVATVEQAIVEHIQAVQQELVRPAEIARVRTRVANQFIFGNETPSDRSGLYGYYQALTGDIAAALQYPLHIQAIEAESLRAAAQEFLSPTAYGALVIRGAK